MINKSNSITLFQGVNNNAFDFQRYKKEFLNHFSHYDDISSINVKSCINAQLVRKYVRCDDRFSIYHPTYYNNYLVNNYKKMVVTVYDMIHEMYHIDRLTPVRKKKILNKADGIIAISQSTKDDLIDIYGFDERKIKVIHLANSLCYEVKEEAIVKENYILFVGNRGGYKNGKLLMESFAHSRLSKDYKLVFMGGGCFTTEEKRSIEDLQIGDTVIQIPGDDKILANLYKYADCFVYPSAYEGFGLPLLEAMHYGTPVITSDSSSMPEVGGNAAVYFNQKSQESLLEALEELLGDKKKQAEYAKKGIERERLFSWDRCADETYNFYCELLDG